MQQFLIRKAQMAQFELVAEKSAEQRAIAHLARYFSSKWQGVPQADQGSFVKRCSSRSRAFGGGSERDTLYFLTLSLLFGEHFADESWAAAILGDRAIGAGDRLACLYAEALRRTARTEARDRARKAFDND